VRHSDLHTGVNYITIKSYRDPFTITDGELAIRYRKQIEVESIAGEQIHEICKSIVYIAGDGSTYERS